MSETRLMKDGLNAEAIERINQAFLAINADFDTHTFYQKACTGLEALELKERVQHIINALHQVLPPDFTEAATLLAQIPKHWPQGDPANALSGFAAWPVINYVAEYGLDHPQIALPLLADLTPLFSAEFAIRPFLIQHRDLTLDYLHTWLTHPNEHVRRLVSEGSRPRLPWGIRLTEFVRDPSPLWPLLTALKTDPSLYVRRSVANSLNDISKDHPQSMLSHCQSWPSHPHTNWIIKHASRSLIKQGHPSALALQGFNQSTPTQVQLHLQTTQIRIGQSLHFSLEIPAQGEDHNLLIDYVVYFVRANGQHNSKVFKLKSLKLPQGESFQLQKQHSFKPISTRRYYAGTHKIAIQINGQELCVTEFELGDG